MFRPCHSYVMPYHTIEPIKHDARKCCAGNIIKTMLLDKTHGSDRPCCNVLHIHPSELWYHRRVNCEMSQYQCCIAPCSRPWKEKIDWLYQWRLHTKYCHLKASHTICRRRRLSRPLRLRSSRSWVSNDIIIINHPVITDRICPAISAHIPRFTKFIKSTVC